MNYDVETRLRDLRQEHGDSILTLLTILLAIMMFVIAPLQATGLVLFQGLGLVVGFVLIGGALVVSGSKATLGIMLVALVLNISVIVLRVVHEPSAVHLFLLASGWLIFAMTLSWIVSRAVFGPGQVNYHRIVGAVFLYLLIALTFSSVFIFVGLLIPNAISGIVFDDSPALASELFYFNFVTLTSTGYGDVLPVHPIARSLCNLETILGQFYPATLLARLVSLEVASRS